MTYYPPTLSPQWATIDGHQWRATRHGAYRKDFIMPVNANIEGGWLEAFRFVRKVKGWLAIPMHPPENLPFPARFRELFKVYHVGAGPVPSSVTLYRGEDPVAFVMACDPTQSLANTINPQGQPWHPK
jgi:hypothetical protein